MKSEVVKTFFAMVVGSAIIIAIAILFVGWSIPARAGFWADKYVDPYSNPQSPVHCCGEADCQPIPVPATDIRRTPNGWLYVPSNEVVPFTSTYVSEDPEGRWWICLKDPSVTASFKDNKRHIIRCLFQAPGGG